MKHLIKLVLLVSIAFSVACDSGSRSTSARQTSKYATSSVPKESALTVKDWAHAVPLPDISTVNLWKLPGAKNTLNNEVLATLNVSTRVGIIEKKSLASGSVYFHVELEDGTRGFIGRPFISRDALGNAFYEKNPETGEVLRDGSEYSYSKDENCMLHVAATMIGDLRKGEFETTAEFKQRKREVSSANPWFSKDLTYTYVYSISGSYDADTQTFNYTSYDAPSQEKHTDYSGNSYSSRKEIPYIEFDDDCYSELGYRYVEYIEDYRTRYGRPDTLLKVMNARLPRNFLDSKYASIGKLGVKKNIGREDAPNYKNANLYFGVKPKTVQSVSKGSSTEGLRPYDHTTKLSGEVSYLFLITQDGKNVIESYISGAYKKSWQKDLQSQLTIAGYDVGAIDGFAGETTKAALESAVADGILPNPEVAMRSTMLLIEHNRNENQR
jgi:hypothetical protein